MRETVWQSANVFWVTQPWVQTVADRRLSSLTTHDVAVLSLCLCPNSSNPQLLFTLTFWLLVRQSVKQNFSRKSLTTPLQEVTTGGSHIFLGRRFRDFFFCFCGSFSSMWQFPLSSSVTPHPGQRRPLMMSRCWRSWGAWWWAAMPSTGSTCVEGCSSWSPLLESLLDTRLSTCCSSSCASVSTRWVHTSQPPGFYQILNCFWVKPELSASSWNLYSHLYLT